ncbi:MAG: glutathione S-transferase family protein [Alphaproteobacteria bacterium]|nr:glutathione S-transferase family protein [Alphaproteobacteria bacterium]
MPALTLVSFDACPYVQRAAILLQEQGRPYDIRYIDLRRKPDWFLAISPNGLVPVLQVDETPIFESTVILEYLDETAETGRLLPADPLERARQRMWISYIAGVMSAGWRVQAARDEAGARAVVTELRTHFAELAKNLPDSGPLWGGETLTMVDVAIAPILQRFAWAEALEPTLGLFDGLPRIQAWRDALLARPSLTASIVPDLEQRSARMLHALHSWVARDVG